MIYGLNFNGTSIPPGIKSKFKRRLRLAKRIVGYSPAVFGLLQGVGQSVEERDIMLVQANNHRRRLHVEERKGADGTWYGIYTY